VASLPNGALVLPGLDQTLDAESWEAILPGHPEHPQYGMRKLLAALGVAREEVQPLPGRQPSASDVARAALASEAMRPAHTTERWHLFAATAGEKAQALAGVSILEAASAEEEAEAVALILREVAETPERTGALVSPDRVLARRVAARLAAWGLEVEDSGGQPLARTPIGAFLELTIEAAASGFAPVALMALLKHPFCRLGLDADTLAEGRRALELAVFRTPYFGQGVAGVAAALEQVQHDLRNGRRRLRAVSRLGRSEWRAAGRVVRALEEAFARLEALLASPGKVSLHALAEAHVAAAEALAADRAGAPAESPWQGAAGEEASRFLAELVDERAVAPDIAAADYPELYRSLVAELAVRPAAPTHPRLAIWEPYESRLQQPDVVVLGSLNEGTWPQAADPGPWLNRPMRAELGMPAPEERIGDAAHIFTSLLGGPQVYLTRAAKIDGVPTVPSRWLLRLQALLGGAGLGARPDRPWLAWARERTALAGPPRPVGAPEPRPPLALRPRQMSATTIERWIANPYAVYAQRILELDPLPALGQPPDAALRGEIVHDALGRFARRFPDRLPEDICAELVALARARLEELTGAPRVAAFWAPRFARFAAWFADTERTRREGVTRTLAEVDGAIVLEGPAGPFTLRARADRIDVGAAGIVISDYKTGANLKELAKRAERGEAPQLPLEAVIALADGFTGMASPRVAGLRYISASGGEPPGQQCELRNGDAAALAAVARTGLLRLIAAFDDPATPYRALRRARFASQYRYDAYAHLARVAEWAAQTAEEA
jgi:ATP-dependent helicase/nuclease subunit B